MFNKMILMGRLVADPELKTTPQGVTVCTFRIAVDRRFQKQGEEKKPDFFNIVAWRQTGEFVQKYFGKGRMILVEGEMTVRPRPIQAVCNVISVDNVHHGTSVF